MNRAERRGKPRIEFSMESFATFPLVAQEAGLPLPEVTSGLLMMWRHCHLNRSRRIKRAVLEHSFFGGRPVVDALVRFGFVEDCGDTIIVLMSVGVRLVRGAP